MHKLKRDLKRHEVNYETYVEHLEHARVDEALEAEHISSINIIQPATFEPKPIKPKLLMGLALGLAIGLCGAVGLPLAVHLFDRTCKEPREVEDWLGVPALASIPRFSSEKLSVHGGGHGTSSEQGNGKI